MIQELAPVVADEPDILDGGDALRGPGVYGWRRVVECVGLFGGFLGGGRVNYQAQLKYLTG